MRTTTFIASMALIAALAFVGCGYDVPGHEIIDDDFQAGNKLLVTSITDTSGHITPIFNGTETIDDSGNATISSDLANISLKNETRLGVAEGVDLHLTRVDVSYYDNNGFQRDFAPTMFYTVTGVVPADGGLDMEIVLIPVEMKIKGLRDEMVLGTEAEAAAVRQWTVAVDVYADDKENGDSVHAHGETTVKFINPLAGEFVVE